MTNTRRVTPGLRSRDVQPVLEAARRELGHEIEVVRRFPTGAWGAWLVQAPDLDRAVLKCIWETDWRARLELAAEITTRLRARDAPVPRFLAHGYEPTVGTWYIAEYLAGTAVTQLHPSLLAPLLGFVESMADIELPGADAWSWSAEVAAVLHDSDGQLDLVRREPSLAWFANEIDACADGAAQLSNLDAVHGDLLITQILTDRRGRQLAGVVDWDAAAVGSRAIDLALLFHNAHVQGDRTGVLPDPVVLRALARAGAEVAGDGFAAAVHYHLLKALAFVVVHNRGHVAWRTDLARRIRASLAAVLGASR